MMVQRKRDYVPKIRGCHECSQRRIHCDRGQPNCAKCVSKGIKCSGLGIRYRFSDDVPSKYKPAQPSDTSETHFFDDHSPMQYIENLAIETMNGMDFVVDDPRLGNFLQSCEEEERDKMVLQTSCAASHFSLLCEESLSADHEAGNLIAGSSTGKISIPMTPPDAFGLWTHHLFRHFSEKIASEMVVIDDGGNGWRHLILPIAHQDELVRETVLAASAIHFSSNISNGLLLPEAIYAKAIRLLHARQNLDSYDIIGKQTVLLALLVLLASVMISGSSDFPTIFNLLESALAAVGGEEAIAQNEMGGFILRQIRKYRGYASPFLSKERGLNRLRLSSSFGQSEVNGWECFRWSFNKHPELAGTMSVIYDLNKQACEIYVKRAMKGADGLPLNDLVDRFIATLDRLPPGTYGEHALVFATFMAASESALPEHQAYFTNVILRHHKRNGFNNLLTALDHLKHIWSGPVERDWTATLPLTQVFIV